MKRKISLQYSLIVIIAIIAFSVGATLIARNNINRVTEHHLEYYLSIIENDYSSFDNGTVLVQKYSTVIQDVRITILNPEGMVVADTNITPDDNHLTRPEFVDLGTPYIRYSETLDKKMMYLAEEMPDGGYLRVAISISSILPFLNDFILFAIFIGTLIIILAVFLITLTTNKALAPLKETVQSLNAVAQGEYIEKLPLEQSEEMNSIINDINDISRMISSNINLLNIEKRKLEFILNRMDQGLCVLDSEQNVIMVNQFVEGLFQYRTELNLNKAYLYLFRNPVIQKIIEDLRSGEENLVSFFSENDRFYSVSANKMIASWEKKEMTLLIFNDITAMKQLETLKRDFFINASHELKSPLTSIIGSSELISSKIVQNPDEITDLASRILQEANRMNNLVIDMLNLSKYENNLLSRADVEVDLSLIVQDVFKSLEPLAQSKHIELISYLEPVIFRADYEHMTQLVRNLTDNAIQYGVENGHVTVKLYTLGDKIRLEVIDDGIGIPKADQSRVFERFYRVDKARSKKTGGTGLGLSIVKHICAMYHAQIALESELNKGTTITITLPTQNE